MVTIDEIQARIKELEEIKTKPKIEYRYENSEDYLNDLIETNHFWLKVLQNQRH